MNTTLKATLALGAAGLSLLGMAGGAGAQTQDPALTNIFSTVKTGGFLNFTGAAVGVGFDPNNGGGRLPVSPNQATAQTVYEPFIFDSSAVGAFATAPTGSTAQIEIFALNNNINGNPTDPFNLYASLYAYNPSAAAGTVPATGPNLFGAQQKVTDIAIGGYFSNDFTLTGPIVAGQQYVLGITTLNGDTQDFAQVASSNVPTSGLSGTISTGDFAFDKTKFVTDGGDQGNPSGQTSILLPGNNVISFQLATAPAMSPVPEASTSLGFALGLGVLGAALVASKRRRSIAK